MQRSYITRPGSHGLSALGLRQNLATGLWEQALKQRDSHGGMHENHLHSFLQHRSLGSTQSFRSVGLGCGPLNCILTSPQVLLMLLVLASQAENHGSKTLRRLHLNMMMRCAAQPHRGTGAPPLSPNYHLVFSSGGHCKLLPAYCTRKRIHLPF